MSGRGQVLKNRFSPYVRNGHVLKKHFSPYVRGPSFFPFTFSSIPWKELRERDVLKFGAFYIILSAKKK